MKCIIQGANIKVFAKAVHSLTKIGSDLYVETNQNGFSIRSVNGNKSAFASFTFHPTFFCFFDAVTNGDEGKCKISMKSCIGVFKNLKQIEYCEISTDSNQEKLAVVLKCRLGTRKKYLLSIVDIETLQVACSAQDLVNKVSGSHKVFADISNNFQMAEEEITLEVGFDSVIVKNYIEGSVVDSKFMRSQLTLKSDEFRIYSVETKVSVTFCLREFRALLNFAEMTSLDLSLNFVNPGEPVLFTVSESDDFEVNLIMSTLSPEDVTFIDGSHHNKSNNQSNLVTDLTTNNDRTTKSINISNVHRNNKSRIVKDIENLSNTLSRNLPKNINTASSSKHVEHVESEDICVTFRDTEEIDLVPSSPTEQCRKKARTVFTRCFEATQIGFDDYSNTILASNSDPEE